MPIDWAVWGPPLATVVAGGVVATVLLQRSANADGDARVEKEGRINDLASTHDEVLEALKHLETEQEKLPPGEYEAERARLLARGSRALAALDGAPGAGGLPTAAPATQAAPAPAAATPPAAPPAIGGEWRGALYALAGMALAWMLWNFIQGESAPRGSGSMTGNLPGEQVGGAPVQDPTQSPEFQSRVAAFQAQLSADPKSMEALNGLTQLYLSHGVPEQAFEWSKKALEVDPKNLDARTYRAVLTAMMGMLDGAMASLDQVLAEDPKQQKALVYKGLILLELGRHTEAVPVLEAALAQEPENPMLRSKLEEAKAGPGAMPPGGAGGPPAGGGELLVGGTLQIDPAAQAALKGTETLFLSLADPAKPGPPVAADRIQGPFAFPIPFDLTTADIRAMPGAAGVPAVMELKARFDADGNAMTKEPGLPLAVVTGVAKGTGGLVVTLTLAGTPTAAQGGAPAGNPMLAPMGAPGAAPAGDTLASGRATLAPGVTATGNEIVFVSVKDPAGGPPLAVKKLPPIFPLDFTVTRADIVQMAGPRPVPAQVTVSVRIDRDGNATTKDGPAAELKGVSTGTTGLALTLQ